MQPQPDMKSCRRKSTKHHYCWVILAVCCALGSAAQGVGINCKGLFIVPVCKELGFRISAFNTYFLFYGISSALMLFQVDKVYLKYPARNVLLVALAVFSASTASMGLMGHLAGWYFVGAVQGLSGAFLMYIPVPMLIHRWFDQRRGMALGVATSAAALCGVIANPLVNEIITRFGWRTGYFAQGIIMLLMAGPALLLVRNSPAELGLQSYGAERVTREEIFKRVKRPEGRKELFFSSVCFSVIIMFAVTFTQQLSSYADSVGMVGRWGALMTSLAMAGSMLARVLQGIICDLYGHWRACWVFLLLAVSGNLLLMAGTKVPALCFAGSFLLGANHSNFSIMIPLSVAVASVPENYDHVLTRVNISTMLSNAVAPTIIGLLYETTGSYHIVFVIFIVSLLAMLRTAWKLFGPRRTASSLRK